MDNLVKIHVPRIFCLVKANQRAIAPFFIALTLKTPKTIRNLVRIIVERP